MLPSGARLVSLRVPCRFCKEQHRTVKRGFVDAGKDRHRGTRMVHCETCKRALYPATDSTGADAIQDRGIGPQQRARILMRDRHCVLCGRNDGLQVGHLVSMAVGLKAGLSEAELDHDENLAALCGACNLGMGDLDMPLWVLVPILKARVKGKK